MYTWYAVYLDREEEGAGEPDALFANEQDAYQWAFDNAMYYTNMQPMTLDTPEPHTTEREIIWK
jgi:hypothetical protein